MFCCRFLSRTTIRTGVFNHKRDSLGRLVSTLNVVKAPAAHMFQLCDSFVFESSSDMQKSVRVCFCETVGADNIISLLRQNTAGVTEAALLPVNASCVYFNLL